MHIVSKTRVLNKLTKLKTSLLSTTPVITSSLKVNKVAQRMISVYLIILVVQTVLEINTDMDVWRWFKCRDYQQGKLGVEAVVIGQKLKLLGGPKHVSVIYEALKASMGSGIQDLEFLVVLDVWDCGLVFSFWKIDGGMLRVYSHYKTKKDIFYAHAGNGFNTPYANSGIYYINWKRSESVPGSEKEEHQSKYEVSVSFELLDTWTLPPKERPKKKYIWQAVSYGSHYFGRLNTGYYCENNP